MTTNKQYDELEALINKIVCPVCGETVIEHYTDICPVCGWEHDFLQSENHDLDKFANNLSVNESKVWFKLKRQLEPNYTWIANASVDGNPTIGDLEKLKKLVEESKK